MMELRAGAARVLVDEQDGGRVKSCSIAGQELLRGEPPVAGTPGTIWSGSFLMAPYGGTLENACGVFRGRPWEVPVNCGPHSVHGLVHDVAWTQTGPGLLVADLDGRWPFGGEVRQRFELEESSLRITASLHCRDRAMPGALGFHPWFARERAAASPAQLEFDARTRFETGLA